MSQCDLCMADISGAGARFTQSDIRNAAERGLALRGQLAAMGQLMGMSDDQIRVMWMQEVVETTPNWTLCEKCASDVRGRIDVQIIAEDDPAPIPPGEFMMGSPDADLISICPHCGVQYKIERAHIGQTGECADCGKDFEITLAGSAPAPPPLYSEQNRASESPDNKPSPSHKGIQRIKFWLVLREGEMHPRPEWYVNQVFDGLRLDGPTVRSQLAAGSKGHMMAVPELDNDQAVFILMGLGVSRGQAAASALLSVRCGRRKVQTRPWNPPFRLKMRF